MVDRRPPCPAPAGEAKGIAIVTLSPGVCEREKVTHFLDFRFAVGWAKERELASLSPFFLSSSVVERSAVN